MREIKAIASKSDAHRALICAALSKNPCKVIMDTTSKDIEATKRCLENLKCGQKEFYCGESGSTLRFLLPVVAALGIETYFYPEGRLPQRPLSPLYEEMIAHGCSLSKPGCVPFIVKGQLTPGDFTIPGNVSSQFISGLLFALPLLNNDSKIFIAGNLQSEDYIKMTIDTLSRFGIEIKKTAKGYFVKGNQKYISPDVYKVEGDWSNAAFFLAAGAFIEDGITVTNLNPDSVQGDKKIVKLLNEFGAYVTTSGTSVTVKPGKLKGIDIDASQIPDMVPALSVIAAGAEGTTKIYNAGRLRIKESDRLKTVRTVIENLGGNVKELEEGLVIKGTGTLKGGNAASFNDHRIAMMAAVASLICKDKVKIEGSEAVNKSYPDFYKHMEMLDLNVNLERD